MKIAVTGATGGIGRTLVPLLAERGCDVLALGRNRDIGASLESSHVRFQTVDLASDEIATLLTGVKVVVHLAARSSPWGPKPDFIRDNVVATSRLLDAMEAAGVQRLVHASTPSIFCERTHRMGLVAGSPPSRLPVNHYAETKLEAERLVRSRFALSVMVLRPSAVIGPHDTAILPRIMRAIGKGVLPVGGKGVMFHPTAVRDAAEAFAIAATGSMRGCANVAGPQAVSVEDMARLLASTAGLAVRVPILPEPLLYAAAHAAEMIGMVAGCEPPITRYTACTLSWSRTFDLAETERILGWHPSVSPTEMLARAVAA